MFDPNLGYDPADPNDPRNPASPLFNKDVAAVGSAVDAKDAFTRHVAGAGGGLAGGLVKAVADPAKAIGGAVEKAGDYLFGKESAGSAAAAAGGASGSKSFADALAAGVANPNAGWTAPTNQAAQIDGSQYGQVRGQQQSLADMLYQQSMGQGPSLAQGQLQRATDRNMSQAMGLGAAQQGAGGASALRGIANARADIGQQGASDSAQLALQEQMAARSAFGGHLAGMAGNDIGLATSQAGLNQQSGLANQTAAIKGQDMSNEMKVQYLQMQERANKGDREAMQWLAEFELKKRGADAGLIGGLASGVGGAVAGLASA